jgi:hypothetical protein
MSSAFAIAAVTAVLKDLLNNGLVDHDLSAVGNVSISALSPDRLPIGQDEKSQINIFLYHVTPNTGWRNQGLPSRDINGGRLTNPPLGLDLHYMVTAYGKEEFHAEALLGYAMQLLHENPVLTRTMINQTLKPTLPLGVTLPPGLQLVSTSDLAEQVELIKISPEILSIEEISKLCAATQAHYRPTAAYQVSVVLIQANKPTRSALPVLSQGPQDQGPKAQSDLQSPFAALESIDLPRNQTSAQMNDALTLNGQKLAGDKGNPALVTLSVLFANKRLPAPIRADVLAAQRTDQTVKLTIPHQVAVYYPAGLYAVSVQIAPNGKPLEMEESNDLALFFAPKIVQINATNLPVPPALPVSVARSAVQNGLGNAILSIKCAPEVLPEQSVSLILGSREFPAAAHASKTDTLSFPLSAVAAGTYRLRLRVDGVDSIFIDRSNPALPKFDDSQQINLT